MRGVDLAVPGQPAELPALPVDDVDVGVAARRLRERDALTVGREGRPGVEPVAAGDPARLASAAREQIEIRALVHVRGEDQ